MIRPSSGGWRLLGILLVAALPGCAAVPLHRPVPEALVRSAEVPELPGIRIWGDEAPPDLEQRAVERAKEMRDRFGDLVAQGGSPRVSYLALSGGGANGAFGAGLLVGWSAAGTRPAFEAVTGVSTGALIAPFAFLGPRYDAQLKEVYTTITTKRIFKPRILAGILGRTALSDTSPLAAFIARHVTGDMLEQIAEAHRKGRRLFVGTTNLEAARPVVWDIGRLANSGHPKALALFRKILRASSAIPGAFPPTLIEVEAAGQRYDELHVDGGVTAQVFAYPAQIDFGRYDALTGFDIDRRLFIVRNGNLAPRYETVKPGLFSISARSIGTLIRNQGDGDLYRIYTLAQRDGLDYNLAYIPARFDVKSDEAFDPGYMNALFDFGYELARDGYRWLKSPPDVDPGNAE